MYIEMPTNYGTTIHQILPHVQSCMFNLRYNTFLSLVINLIHCLIVCNILWMTVTAAVSSFIQYIQFTVINVINQHWYFNTIYSILL